MIKARLICKIKERGNDKIVGYTIQDDYGVVRDISSDELKQAIRDNQIEVRGLKLTSDNRLITVAIHEIPQQQSVINNKIQKVEGAKKIGWTDDGLMRFLKDAKEKGGSIETYDTDCGHKFYIVARPGGRSECYILIPSDVTCICSPNNKTSPGLTAIRNLNGTVWVFGGAGLKTTYRMFYSCKFKNLKAQNFYTHNCEDMTEMFAFSKMDGLRIDLVTDNVKTMDRMFAYTDRRYMTFTDFKLKSLTSMEEMFMGCKAYEITIGKLNPHNNVNTLRMFKEYEGKLITEDLRIQDAYNNRHVQEK